VNVSGDSGESVLVVGPLRKSFAVEDSFVQRLKRFFNGDSVRQVIALDIPGFSVGRGETLGILGESGSGKSTLARVLMGIYEADAGSARLNGRELVGVRGAEKLATLRQMQMIFQDPFGSLDPRMTVRQIISEPLKIHGIKPEGGIDGLLVSALKEVGLEPGALERYPAEFSGGQRQRIGICRALILGPRLVIADEAVSALDVSVQAQILELLMSLREKRQLSMIFISHDVAVVRQISDRIILLYHGNLVEELPADSLIEGSKHPYTRRLLESALFLREGNVMRERPDTAAKIAHANAPDGCCYFAICPRRSEKCQQKPELIEVGVGHRVSCWHHG
jgi:oligopeptide/dipeptide ABC transporter ATP-binding protein